MRHYISIVDNRTVYMTCCQCVHLTDCDVSGAQSDSEVVSSQPVEGGTGVGEATVSDRGYTSDSELYENLSRHGKNAGEMDVKPTKHGSWLLVSYSGLRLSWFEIVMARTQERWTSSLRNTAAGYW